jgi:hypothetical protein
MECNMPNDTPPNDTPDTPELEEIYRQLQHGAGHQWVNDDNVGDLIDLAVDREHRLIEVQLREWRAPCAPAPEDDRR